MLTEGLVVQPEDDLTALRLRAESGDAQAQHKLGEIYEVGTSWDEALADCLYFLGDIKDETSGVDRDYAQAAYWFRKSAEQGHAEAHNNLGLLHGTGRGVPEDPVQAETGGGGAQDSTRRYNWISKRKARRVAGANR